MPMQDPVDGTISSAAYGYDTHAAVADEPSLFDTVGDLFTKAAPLTGLAVFNSFANTGVEIGNLLGGDFQKLTVEDEVGDGDLNDYYNQHKQGIEAAALVAGSFIPGGLAVKGANTAVKALWLAKRGLSTEALARATGLLAPLKSKILEGALQEIEAGPAGLYAQLNADKLKLIALGVGDQALQGLVYETATAATMHASPLLDDNGVRDTAENMFYGALLGAGIGGTLEGIGVRAILNKALLRGDISTKQQELATYLASGVMDRGGSAFNAGDRVALLVKSIDDIPTPTNELGTKKFLYTQDQATINAKKILTSITGGDNEVSNAAFDTLMDMKASGTLTKEDFYQKFARLAKISRIDEEASVPLGDTFFVNKFAKNQARTWNDLVTTEPHPNANVSAHYRLAPGSTEVKIGRFSDEFSSVGGDIKVPRYVTSEDAFKDGMDIFVNRKLQVVVNPKAQNVERIPLPGMSRSLTDKEARVYAATGKLPEGAAKLFSAPVILNTLTKDVTTEAYPVVGDFGKPELFDKGLRFGDRTSLQSTASILTKETPTLEANARYVWAAQRGIKGGDTLGSSDIPMLEQFYRQAQDSGKSWEQYVQSAVKRNITLDDGEAIPLTSDGFLNKIRDAKNNLISDLINENPKMSSKEVAQRANVPEDYIKNSFKASSPKDYMVDPAQHEKINHVQLEYDLNNVKTPDGQILKGMIDVQYRIQVIQDAFNTAMAKKFGDKASRFVIDGKASDANIEGARSGFLTTSNSNYDTLGNKAERVGREVTKYMTEKMASISDALLPSANKLRNNPKLAAEVGNFVAVRRMTGEQFTFLDPTVAAANGIKPVEDGGGIAVLARAISKDADGNTIWDRTVVPDGFVSGDLAKEYGQTGPALHTYYTLSKDATDWELANLQVNNPRVYARNNWYAAQGMSNKYNSDILYAPSIDTNKYPHFALVRARPGSAFQDDNVAIITAKSAEELKQKASLLQNDYQVIYKQDIKKYHEVLGDYNYDRNFSQGQVNAALRREGILNNIFPDTSADSIIKDYIDYHSKQELRLTRDYVEMGNAQLFAELRAIGDRFTSEETSKTGFTAAALGRSVTNPYNSYIKTALAISDRDEYRLWADAQEKLEAYASSAFSIAKQAFGSARRGLIPYEEAAAISYKAGLGNPYGAATDALKAYRDVANQLPPKRYLSQWVGTANSILAATAIRLDVFQSLINVVSTPVLLLAEANSAKNFLTTALPDGSGRSVPATSKILFSAVRSFFSKDTDYQQTMPLLKDIGAVRDVASEIHQEMINNLALPAGRFSESEMTKKLAKAVDLGATITGSKLSEELVRYAAGYTAKKIFQSAGYGGQQLLDNISTFVNRVHGNYVASQRPVAFQGPLGQALGLFQTYQFNLMQQLFRYVQNGEAKTVALMAGMQTTLFGINGLPGFQMINNHIIGNAADNPAHKDVFSTTTNLFGKQLGDWLLYGSVSNVLNTGLYGRGDINPRQITVLPLNPLDFPAISGGIKLMSSILDTINKTSQGASLPASILLGLEHNGLSRPLSGLAQLAQGFVSTSAGQIIAAVPNGFNDNAAGFADLFSAANFSRLLGARPLDEAIAMDGAYRSTLYQAKNEARIQDLGEAVKTKLYNNGNLTEDELSYFAGRYAANGGNIQSFSRSMMTWTQQANVALANKVFKNMQKPINQQLQIIMGGQRLPDFTSPQFLNQTAGTEVAPTQ